MARKLRVEYAGAVYHVMARGNERKSIYRDIDDRQMFIKTLGQMCQQFGIEVHVWCLMDNHFHVVLETAKANLSSAMRWMQTTYTVRFNKKHKRSGHLFQGRYKAQLVQVDEYARHLVEYIHLNPARIGLKRGSRLSLERKEKLEHHQWSSHWVYNGKELEVPAWQRLDWLGYYGSSRKRAMQEYRRRINEWFGRELLSLWDEVKGGLVLGQEGFYKQMMDLLEGRNHQEARRLFVQHEKQEAYARLEKALEKEVDDRIKIWCQVRLIGASQRQLAAQRGYATGSAILQIVKRLERKSAHDSGLADRLEAYRKLGQLT